MYINLTKKHIYNKVLNRMAAAIAVMLPQAPRGGGGVVSAGIRAICRATIWSEEL